MKIYIYNCNYLNEYLEEIETEHPEQWAGSYTETPPPQSDVIGKSYAFNPTTQAWDTLIDDWRGIMLYRKIDSRISQLGQLGPKKEYYTYITPPDNETKYVFNDDTDQWQEYIEMVNISNVLKEYEDAIQRYIDEVAQERGYDNGYTCASYFQDKNARYASDAQVFKDWRSDVWVAVNTILNQYKSQVEGSSEIPTSALVDYPTADDIIANLPQIEWVDIAEKPNESQEEQNVNPEEEIPEQNQ